MDDRLLSFTSELRKRLGDRALQVARLELSNSSGDIEKVWREIVEILERPPASRR